MCKILQWNFETSNAKNSMFLEIFQKISKKIVILTLNKNFYSFFPLLFLHLLPTHCEICMENTRNKWKSDRHFLANVTETKFGLLEQCSKIRKKCYFRMSHSLPQRLYIYIYNHHFLKKFQTEQPQSSQWIEEKFSRNIDFSTRCQNLKFDS